MKDDQRGRGSVSAKAFFVNPKSAIRNPKSLCRFRNLTGLNAGGADFHAAGSTLGQRHPDRLQVWIKLARRAVVCVRHIIAELGRLAADFTAFSHYFLRTSR